MTGTQVLERQTIDDEDSKPVDIRAAARDDYSRGAAEGNPPTGAELGRRYGQSERWGRYRVAECRTDGNGNHPDSPPEPSGTDDVPVPADGTEPERAAESAIPLGADGTGEDIRPERAVLPDLQVVVHPDVPDGG